MLDQEHAPFDIATLDHLALASHAGDSASHVRVADASPSRILAVLDLRFAGVIVPHIRSVKEATCIVEVARYATGKGGYSASRAGRYGAKSIQEHVESSHASTIVIAMIEELTAVEAVQEITSVKGIDALLIGRRTSPLR